MKRLYKTGFTLIEMVLAIVIIAASSLAAGSMLINGIESYGRITERRQMLRTSRFALSIMRNKLETISNPATDIRSIGSKHLTFLPAGSASSVTYDISGNQLTQDGNALADDLTENSMFSYLDVAGANTNVPENVASIVITLEIDAGVSEWGKINLIDRIYLRNRYYQNFDQ